MQRYVARSGEGETRTAVRRLHAPAGPAGARAEALAPLQARANAGPHAAALAGLQAVVAQRACADCDRVKETMGGTVQRAAAGGGAGLPDGLRAGLESLSGRDLSGVRVHYGSPKPAQLEAHAYTQGSEIHVAAGEERHLPHEGWHAVQQMEGRVRPTLQLHGTAINDDAALEREADAMGARALRAGAVQRVAAAGASRAGEGAARGSRPTNAPVQRAVVIGGNNWYTNPTDITYAARQAGANERQAAWLARQGNDGFTHRYGDWSEAIRSVPEEELQGEMHIGGVGGVATTVETTIQDPLADREEAPKRERMVENATRLGFEIEVGRGFMVEPGFLSVANRLVNVTLAETDLLEFLIDDVSEKEKRVQIEFRTKPLSPEAMADAKSLDKQIKSAITRFPIKAFQGNVEELGKALTEQGWTPTPALAEIAPGLVRDNVGRLTANPVQHVTHSIPLAGFVKLSSIDKGLLVPGTQDVGTVGELLLVFFNKLKAQVKGGTIHVSTTGRNKNAPNMKTALDTVIGLLDPDYAGEVLAALGERPHRVDVAGGDKADLGEPEIFKELPEFPRTNPQEGRGYLAAEEKLKAPMFDTLRGDVRVLVEHRGDALVGAVRAAMGGKTESLQPYLDAFAKLDSVQGDPVFARWFQ